MASGSFHIPQKQTPEQVEALFASQRSGDRVGHRIHLLLAAGGCFFAGWETTFAEWAMLPVLICFLVRMTGQHRVLEPLAFDRVVRLWLAFGAWLGVSVMWSHASGPKEWLTDVQSMRFFVLPLILWPVLDRRAWLIGALVAGIACGQMSQIVHLASVASNATWQPFQRMPGRISGWWDPVVGGSVLCAGLGLWLGAALYARTTRVHLIGMAGSLATVVCIALTGTRGAWIAGALLLGIAAWILVRRTRFRAAALGTVIAIVLVGGTLGIGACAYVMSVKDPAMLPGIAQRLRHGIDEVRGSGDPRGYETDTGLRLAMWKWGWAALRTHPLIGVGAGGYKPWVRAQSEEQAIALGVPAGAITRVHSHAHSWYVHTFATLGMIGGSLLLWLIGRTLVAGMRGPVGVGWFAHGPPLALAGLACAGLFDSITVNQQTALLFFVLIGLCLPTRPREAGGRDAVGAGGTL